ncbi:unnamed protein product [Phytophthora lilii]|uniref:Unnamed protein product n=1 Tax=Phytophthora lilii TaxID=2077276 RepID=A0A9W7CLQ3_9STRA|nr:unnamed protein product [Phytophthora lilii]
MSVQTLQTQHLVDKDDSVGVVFVKTTKTEYRTFQQIFLLLRVELKPYQIVISDWSPERVLLAEDADCMLDKFRKQLSNMSSDLINLRRYGEDIKMALGRETLCAESVATFACGGSTGGPSIVDVCLRCGWSIGGVQNLTGSNRQLTTFLVNVKREWSMCLKERKWRLAISRELLREEIRALLDEDGLHREVKTDNATPPPNPVPLHHSWGGKFHVLPQDFNFPSINPLGAWLTVVVRQPQA